MLRRKKKTPWFLCALLAFWTIVSAKALSAGEPVRVFFDTDMAMDCDDLGAAAMLHVLADAGEAEIVAMAISSKDAYAAACLDVVNTYYGRGDIPIGAVKGPGVEEKSKYTEAIAKAFPHDLPSTAAAPDAVAVYRKALADQPDGSLVVITVGYLTNLKNLLQSPPDPISPLPGAELVKKKVKHWVCMGLTLPKGREWNIHRDTPASIAAIGDWPMPITFSGFEIGKEIMTGFDPRDATRDNPIRVGYGLYTEGKPRPSWDQTAVLFAVRGPGELWDVHQGGSVDIRTDGSNQWRDAPDRGLGYLVKKAPASAVAEVIGSLMHRPPKNRRPASNDQ